MIRIRFADRMLVSHLTPPPGPETETPAMPETNWRDDATKLLYDLGYGPWSRSQILWHLQAEHSAWAVPDTYLADHHRAALEAVLPRDPAWDADEWNEIRVGVTREGAVGHAV